MKIYFACGSRSKQLNSLTFSNISETICVCEARFHRSVPFLTSGEAERRADQLGWKYVAIYQVVSGDPEVYELIRIYEVSKALEREESYAARSKRKQVNPLTADEEKFFAFYEEQMTGVDFHGQG